MANRLVSLVALVAATATIVALRRSSRRATHDVKLQPIQTWEGEGGALPATGAQMGPDPALGAALGPATDDPSRDVPRQATIPGIH